MAHSDLTGIVPNKGDPSTSLVAPDTAVGNMSFTEVLRTHEPEDVVSLLIRYRSDVMLNIAFSKTYLLLPSVEILPSCGIL